MRGMTGGVRASLAALGVAAVACATSAPADRTDVVVEPTTAGPPSVIAPSTASLAPPTGRSTATPSSAAASARAGATASPVEDPAPPSNPPAGAAVRTGADVLVADSFRPLAGLRVGLIANQTSTSAGTPMIDLLHAAPGVELAAVFTPEHGVRGTAGAGEAVGDTVDPATGVPIISLYKPGSGFRPSQSELAGIDILVYDLQDVGARFYTYIATMGRSMEAAAHAGIPFMVLDRPNPSGGAIVEGFTRTPEQASFVAEYPLPARYGLTAGELARMIAGEGWKDVAGLDLRVVPLQGWDRSQRWPDTGRAWVPPSPGLPTADAALTYPGTVLVEATSLSFGRGTTAPFTQVGAPWLDPEALVADLAGRGLGGVRFQPTSFVPRVIPGMAEDPAVIRFLGQTVPAVTITPTGDGQLRSVLVGVHLVDALRRQAAAAGIGEIIDRPETFDLLAGTPELRRLLTAGTPPDEVAAAWQPDVDAFLARRQPYLLY